MVWADEFGVSYAEFEAIIGCQREGEMIGRQSKVGIWKETCL
jgi:hypothetical protein